MYLPSHFEITQRTYLQHLMFTYPLGVLITQHNGLDANHLPFLFDAAQDSLGRLSAHIARANPLCATPNGSEVLVVFRGEAGYISPNAYPSKHETHRQVPTWNYEVVHVHGKLTVRDDAKFVRGVVGRLTKIHEATQSQPWKMSDAPADYLEAMVQAVVGVEIAITRIEGKSKMSQNKEPRDQQGVVHDLQARGQHALADAVAKANGLTASQPPHAESRHPNV
jgi:transcriptional regulator